jgi:hypothetical protein
VRVLLRCDEKDQQHSGMEKAYSNPTAGGLSPYRKHNFQFHPTIRFVFRKAEDVGRDANWISKRIVSATFSPRDISLNSTSFPRIYRNVTGRYWIDASISLLENS